MRKLAVSIESWPIAGTFTISRGSRTEARVVVATISDGEVIGRGECVPYPRYGETVDSVAALIATQSGSIAEGMSRQELRERTPAGAARNAIDCALWDLEAKYSKVRVWQLAGAAEPVSATTAYTLSLGDHETMETAAKAASSRSLLKVKLGGPGDVERIAAVRRGAPNAALIVDANEAWSEACFAENIAACAAAGVKLIEQPFPASADEVLKDISPAQRLGIPMCADESLHDRAGLAQVAERYQAINIKLDKTGGLTEALDLLREAKALGLMIMVGCMVGTSLAMAPAMLLTNDADFVDLDGPLLLAEDRKPGLRFEGSLIHLPVSQLWG